jgi:flagellar M-ring protein FliF
MAQARTLLMNMTPKGRLILAGSVVAVVVLVFLMMRMASAPSYTTVMAGVDPAQTGKITAALDEKGVKYEIRNNGTAIAVDKAQMADARIALAEKGLPNSNQPGYELFEEQKLGASDFQQQVAFQRGLEGELAKTIGQIDGVGGATVRLVLPQDQLFEDKQSAAKASVLLSSPGDALEPGSVRGIAQLVSGSVQGLGLNQVSITDNTGQLLWPSSAGGASDGQMAATAKQAAEARYAQTIESNLNAMLATTLGPDKAQVQVNAELNMDRATRDELEYGEEGVPLQSSEEQEALEGGGGAAGAAGTATNTVPGYAAGGGAGGSQYDRTKDETQWGVDKRVTRTKVAPGAVNKMNVAVMVDASVPRDQVAAVRQAVQSAAGVDPGRGDRLSVSQVAFAKPPAPAEKPITESAVGFAKYVAAGLGLLLFLFFVTRHLRRRESETLMGQPVWLREIEAPTTVAELEAGGGYRLGPGADDASGSGRRQREPNPIRGELEEMIDHEPERVAQQVRAWMNED